MSHVADALRRANRHVAAGGRFRDDDHPWTADLRTAVLDAGEREPACELPSAIDERARAEAPAIEGVEASEPARIRPLTSSFGQGIRQQIAGLVERVFLPAASPAPRIVGFASVDGADDAGPIAASVAETLAERTSTTTGVLDLNFRAPSLHTCFAVSATPGVLDALASDAPLLSAARHVRDGLWVIPAGGGDGRVVTSARVRTELLRRTLAFDRVVIVLEPLTSCATHGIATAVDGVVLVIDALRTRRDTGRAVAEDLQASGARVLGAVLTNRRYPIPEAIYRRL